MRVRNSFNTIIVPWTRKRWWPNTLERDKWKRSTSSFKRMFSNSWEKPLKISSKNRPASKTNWYFRNYGSMSTWNTSKIWAYQTKSSVNRICRDSTKAATWTCTSIPDHSQSWILTNLVLVTSSSWIRVWVWLNRLLMKYNSNATFMTAQLRCRMDLTKLKEITFSSKSF